MRLKTIPVLLYFLCVAMAFPLFLGGQASLEAAVHKGKVLETMASGGYTYIQFEEKGKKLWVACKQMEVAAGDEIEFTKAAPMKNFHSRTLGKTFETILFVGYVKVKGADGKMRAPSNAAPHPKPKKRPAENVSVPEGHPAMDTMLPKGHRRVKSKQGSGVVTVVAPGSVKKAKGGQTVAECYGMKDSLAGKTARVRGRVVKYNGGIMGKNWIHIQDGSGEPGTNDITVTTKKTAEKGDLILVTGKIGYDKKIGPGYTFPVIIEDAEIVVEK